jgi:RecB family exonuclease
MTRYEDVIETSNSEVQAFRDCERRWWLSYFRRLRLKRETVIGPLSIGGRVHKALEEGYSTPGRAKALRKVLAESIEEDYPKAVEAGEVEQFESECELAVIMLEGFIEWASEEGLDAGWEVMSHERIVKAPPIRLAGENVVLKGKLDQIVRREMDGSLWMRDWKTTITMKPVMMAFGPQLKMYRLLLALTEPEAKVSGGQFVFLKKVKRTTRANPPFYSVEQMYVSSTEMENYWKQTLATVERMVQTTLALEAGGDHHKLAPPRPTRDCEWRCPFYAVCPMFDDGSRVEQLLLDAYEVSDPYAYYDDPDNKETET